MCETAQVAGRGLLWGAGWGGENLVPAGGLQSRASLSFLSSQMPMQTCHPRPAARLPSSSLAMPWVVRWAFVPLPACVKAKGTVNVAHWGRAVVSRDQGLLSFCCVTFYSAR